MAWPHTPLGVLAGGLGLCHPAPALASGAEVDPLQKAAAPSPLLGALGTRAGLSLGPGSRQAHRLEGKTCCQTDATGTSSVLGPPCYPSQSISWSPCLPLCLPLPSWELLRDRATSECQCPHRPDPGEAEGACGLSQWEFPQRSISETPEGPKRTGRWHRAGPGPL